MKQKKKKLWRSNSNGLTTVTKPSETAVPQISIGGIPNSTELSIGEKASVVQRFFDSTPSQLSMDGLFHLHSLLREGELAVLFRNNHFSTITKYNNTLYSLITDIGFVHDLSRVWETLSLTGDVVMVDASFAERHAPAASSSFDAQAWGFESLAVADDDDLIRVKGPLSFVLFFFC